MSRAKRLKAGNSINGLFFPVFYHLLMSPNFCSLSGSSVKLFFSLAAQIRPAKGLYARNNGDLTVALSVLRPFGFKSQNTVTNAKNELLEKGWIELTKLGGLEKGPSLYALTIFPINECGGKLDVQATDTPSNAWREYQFQDASPDIKTKSKGRK